MEQTLIQTAPEGPTSSHFKEPASARRGWPPSEGATFRPGAAEVPTRLRSPAIPPPLLQQVPVSAPKGHTHHPGSSGVSSRIGRLRASSLPAGTFPPAQSRHLTRGPVTPPSSTSPRGRAPTRRRPRPSPSPSPKPMVALTLRLRRFRDHPPASPADPGPRGRAGEGPGAQRAKGAPGSCLRARNGNAGRGD